MKCRCSVATPLPHMEMAATARIYHRGGRAEATHLLLATSAKLS